MLFSLRFNEWKISNFCFKLHSLGGTTINIVTYSVNVRVKFYSIEGTTIYDAAYSVNLDLQTLFSTPVTKSKMSLFLLEITFAGGATVKNVP